MNKLPHFKPGDSTRIRSAATMNAVMDAVRHDQQKDLSRDQQTSRRDFPLSQNNQIWIRNQQPYAQAINNLYAIVAISTPVFDAGNSPEELQSFLFNPALDVTWPATPASEATWGVALSPMNHGGIERAVVAGSCVARVSIDANPGDSVGVSNDAADQTADILVPTSGGAAIVVSVSSSQPDAYPGPPYKWAVIKFGGGGGTTEIVRFNVLSANLGTIGLGSTERCDSVQAVITRVVCGSSLQIGDVMTVWDIDRCWFNIPLDILVVRSGTAILMRNDDNGSGGAPNCTGIGYLRPDACFWMVSDLCCGEEAYASI